MKKILYIILSCIILTGCELEQASSGSLDGNWQFRQIDTLATEGITDMSASYIYWAVESNLLLVRDIDNNNLKIFFRFDYSDEQLTIKEPSKTITKDELIPINDPSILIPFGIQGLEDHFAVEQNSHSNLILRNEQYRLHFRKY